MAEFPPATKSPEATVPTVKLKGLLIKSIVLILIAVVGGVLYSYTPLKVWLTPAGRLAEWFGRLGGLGVIVFVFGSAILILLGVPRILLCALAGALYGFWGGLAVSTAGTLLSYYGTFLWIRGRRSSGLNGAALPKQLSFLNGDPGFTGVVIGRLLPAPGMLITLGLSLSSVSHRAYLAGSVVGSLPMSVFCVLAGALGRDFSKWGRLTAIGLVCILGVWILYHHLNRKAQSLKAAAHE